MVTGRRKPFLNTVRDAKKLARNETEFEALKHRETLVSPQAGNA